MLNKIYFFIVLTFSTHVLGGSTGYVYQGKTYYLYKNGETVEAQSAVEVNRSPAAEGEEIEISSSGMRLYFSEDELVRCYYWDKKQSASKRKKSKNSNIHCFKLTDLKEHP